MVDFVRPILNSVDTFLAWLSTSLKQTTESYCDLETANDSETLVAHDGSLISIIKIEGVTKLLGKEEFTQLCEGLSLALQTNMKREGYAFQFYFSYDRDNTKREITNIFQPSMETAKRLNLQLSDLFKERVNYLARYCGDEKTYLVLWTRPAVLAQEQLKIANKEKIKRIRDEKVPPFKNTQNLAAEFPEIRDNHKSLVHSILNDLATLAIDAHIVEVHDALRAIRESVDPDFTDTSWRPVLPGDKIPMRDMKDTDGDLAGILWPPLAKQILPRDVEDLDIRTCRIGDRLFSSIFIELFPQEIQPFSDLFGRIVSTGIPWRISYFVESKGLKALGFKNVIASILSFASEQNRLIGNATEFLRHIELDTDDAVVKLRVSLSTWAPENEMALLRTRTAELARAVEGWGSCDVTEISGDAFAGAVSSMLAVTTNNIATTSVAPLSDVIYMSPITRPASPWRHGAVIFRSPDGKPWPYQPGSAQQTTWIDLLYARPGSGKSVLSNTINLALCLAPGIQRLPRIAIIDIGPSSSGLISLLKDALPKEYQHFVAYHRLRMTEDYSINPFDTQLGCRYPTPLERSFLVNFLTLLATPVSSAKPYDGISDMAGMIVDEIYKNFSDKEGPRVYTDGMEPAIDKLLADINFKVDEHTTWWEVTDALFVAGYTHEAIMAQRYAMPLLADAASISRTEAIEDLYGKVEAPTGETLTVTFNRMISSAVREYPILSRMTRFDIGDARVISLDLDEVAKSGGEAADRQTAVMYMLARYVLAKHFYLTEDNVEDMPKAYQAYHRQRITEIREDPKRLVYDEFHRTSKAQAVRDQVVVDMREGRKWNVQIALISQSLDDFDKVMVEFATSIFIMDAGPSQTIQHSAEIFGLNKTAQIALRTRVHGPREGGATFLAQFATKEGMNTQLLTSTIGPVGIWAFSTTAEDAAVRNKLYKRLGPTEARRVLANLFPSGSIKSLIDSRMAELKERQGGVIEDGASLSVADKLIEDVLHAYSENPDVKRLP